MFDKLDENGRIPAFTECPFKDKCCLVDTCYHTGIKHDVPFSCGFARAFDITKRSRNEK
jgi:hypothetical protein